MGGGGNRTHWLQRGPHGIDALDWRCRVVVIPDVGVAAGASVSRHREVGAIAARASCVCGWCGVGGRDRGAALSSPECQHTVEVVGVRGLAEGGNHFLGRRHDPALLLLCVNRLG